ncbi:hypothetical protein S7711_10657 [Stachybotrys chartarum IBT 7711]|uniref:Uncharacterized protein n=1 Tax=Stachybotrys chartarum (strain CBS 109288 / IBT 7711) TaxID=1280523 RepID=A0A084B2I9_STACB|nr:hypothetical protein S7711_10657 [Stachybotrys chartarum IBT 7711]KFA74242.1 hypothetical protein S40288_11673 [Stachybotrys chartarum IBT 40288]
MHITREGTPMPALRTPTQRTPTMLCWVEDGTRGVQAQGIHWTIQTGDSRTSTILLQERLGHRKMATVPVRPASMLQNEQEGRYEWQTASTRVHPQDHLGRRFATCFRAWNISLADARSHLMPVLAYA